MFGSDKKFEFPGNRVFSLLAGLLLNGVVTALNGGTVTAAELKPGQLAPEFTAKNQDGKQVRLSDFQGRPVLLYFYPKDDTPGCTREACSFRDEYSKFKKLGAVILGVSTQDEKSHQGFRAKHRLPFDLLVDSDGKLAESFGVGSLPMIGLLKRQSVLIGRDGRVVRFYADVDQQTHASQVLEELQQLQMQTPKPVRTSR